jgi:hypothetical protein
MLLVMLEDIKSKNKHPKPEEISHVINIITESKKIYLEILNRPLNKIY